MERGAVNLCSTCIITLLLTPPSSSAHTLAPLGPTIKQRKRGNKSRNLIKIAIPGCLSSLKKQQDRLRFSEWRLTLESATEVLYSYNSGSQSVCPVPVTLYHVGT